MDENIVLSETELARWLTYRDEEASDFVHIWAHLRPQWSNVDLGLDDDSYYLYYGHPLWLYFKNSYDIDSTAWLPMCICESPYIPLPRSKYRLDISDTDFETVKKFVIHYESLLRQVADGESSGILFDVMSRN